MIFLPTKYHISRIAAKEAKGSYGEFLIKRQKALTGDSAANSDFQPSAWMKSVISDYTNTVEKLFTKTKNMNVLYVQMKQYYVQFNELNEELNVKKTSSAAAVSDIDAQIASIESEITEISRLLRDFHEGKPLPNGLTSRKLLGSKTSLEQRRSQMWLQKNSASDLSSAQNEYDQLAKELKAKVLQLESDFVIELDLFYKKIRKIELKYNEQMNYYWQKLFIYVPKNKLAAKSARTLQITEPIKQLMDIAPLCNAAVLSKEDLFKNERDYINSTINQTMGIQYEV